jgi:hypothetical protein
MWKYLDIKTISSALIVAAIVSIGSIWGNSKLLDYKFGQLEQAIGILQVEKVDKVLVERLNTEIVGLKIEKADRLLVESKWIELKSGLLDVQQDMKYLIRLHISATNSKR